MVSCEELRGVSGRELRVVICGVSSCVLPVTVALQS